MLGYLWLHKYQIRFWHLASEFCALLGLCCGPEHSFILVKSTQCIFFTSNSEQFWSFLYVFILVLNFLKALGFCQNFIITSITSLLIFSLFLHDCEILELIFSSQSQNLQPLISCWSLKYYLGCLLVHCHHRYED